jgi:tetratricopeptide (TPR) repeat protein
MRTAERLQVALALLLALALRLVHVLQVHDLSLVFPEELDPAFYFGWAKQIAAGGLIGQAPFVQSPLYAYLLGLFLAIFGAAIGPILAAQSIVGCGTVLLTYVAGRRLFDHRRGLLAALLVAVYGPFIFYEGMVMKTFLSPFLTILLVVLLERAGRAAAAGGDPATAATPPADPAAPARIGRAFALAGLVYGLTTIDRDNFIVLAPALALVAFAIGGGRRRHGLRAAAAFTIGTLLVIAPVTLRNWAVSGEFVLLTTGGGEVFFIGNNPDANGMYVPPPFVRPDPKFEHADFIARASEIAGRQLTPMESSWFWFREGVKFIVEEPAGWARLLALKLLHFWNHHELPDNLNYEILQRFSPLLDLLNVPLPSPSWPTIRVPSGDGRWLAVRLHLWATFGTLAPLGLAGLVLTWRDRRRLLSLYVLLFGYMATVMLFFNFSRFRVPVVPILALFGATALLAIGRRSVAAAGLIAAFLRRAGDLPARLRDFRPSRRGALAAAVLLAATVVVNVELPRGVVPAIEEALIVGNAHYGDRRWDAALQSYLRGLLLLGEGPPGPEGDLILREHFGPEATREAIGKELEVETVARGDQFKGMHIGIHHGLGIAMIQKASGMIERGDRAQGLRLIDQAIPQFQEALRLAPAYMLSIRKLAQAYALKGDPAQAEEWLRRGVEYWPEDLQGRLELAELLYNNRQFPEALRQIDEGLALNPGIEPRQKAVFHFHRGIILLRGIEDPARALNDLEMAIATDPSLPQATEVRTAIEGLRRRGIVPVADPARP